MENLVLLSDNLLHAWRSLPLGPAERSIAWALVLGAGLFFCIYLVERIYGAPRHQYASRSFLHDIAYWFYYRTGLHYFLFLAPMSGLKIESVSSLNVQLLATLPYALQALLYFVILDFFYYWIHRAQHHFRFLWAFHTTHHSQEQLNCFTSLRFHPVDHLVQGFLIYPPLLVLGFSESTWMPVFLLGAFKELVQHSRIPWRFGTLYPVLVSPVFHSYHHSKDPAHHDKNFAGLLSFWDYLFGTAVIDDRRGPSRFGLENVVPTTLASTILAPFRLLRDFYGVKATRRQ